VYFGLVCGRRRYTAQHLLSSGLPAGFTQTPVSTPPVYSKRYLSELQAATPSTPPTTEYKPSEEYDELTRSKFADAINDGKLSSSSVCVCTKY
jgi:hypothetical protein